MADQSPELVKAREKFEAALVEYISLMHGEPAVLTGYIFKCRGMSANTLESGRTMGPWGCGMDQDVFVTLGLAEALSIDISTYYAMSEDDGDED